MKFEETIKKISAIVASFVVFFFAASIYLSAKGFIMHNGQIVLTNSADARTIKEDLSTGNSKKNLDAFVPPKGNILGDEKAPVTMYEYSSLGCSHCADFHLSALPKIKKELIDTGKLNFVFADFPLDRNSLRASMLARCMPKDKYFDFLNLLFKKQRDWHPLKKPQKILLEYAALNGLSKEDALKCMKSDTAAKDLDDIRQQAFTYLGLEGTPSFLLVHKDSKQLFHGAPSYGEIKEFINDKLGNQ